MPHWLAAIDIAVGCITPPLATSRHWPLAMTHITAATIDTRCRRQERLPMFIATPFTD
jgi:hypothetical protein